MPTNKNKEIIQYLIDNAESVTDRQLTRSNFRNDFKIPVESPIGKVAVLFSQYAKLIEKKRHNVFSMLKPTIERPTIIIKDNDAFVFIKAFKKNEEIFMYAAVKEKGKEWLTQTSAYKILKRRLEKKVESGDVIFPESIAFGKVPLKGVLQTESPKIKITLIEFGLALNFIGNKYTTKTVTMKKILPKMVEVIDTDVKYIRRYIYLNNRIKTKAQILELLADLQNTILKKEITKKSEYSAEIEHIQDELISLVGLFGKALNSKIDISIDADRLKHYKSIANSEKQKTSIRLIARYNRLQGKPNVKLKAKELLADIESAIKNNRINSDKHQITAIKKHLINYIGNKDILTVSDNSLSGVKKKQLSAEDYINLLEEKAVPFRRIPFTYNSFLNEFGIDFCVETPIGKVYINYDQFEKIEDKNRETYFGLIKPTLEKPVLLIKHNNRELFVKSFLDKKNSIIYFISVTKDDNGTIEVVSNHKKSRNNLLNKIKEGTVRCISSKEGLGNLLNTGSNVAKSHSPKYITISIGIPLSFTNLRKKSDIVSSNNKKIVEKKKILDKDIVSSTDFKSVKFTPMRFVGKWKQLIGNPAKPFTMMTYAKPGQGKSTMNIAFAYYLADKHNKKVLFVADEEKLGYTLQEKLKRLEAFHTNFFVTDHLPEKIGIYDFVVFDSVNSMDLTADQLKDMKEKNPKTSFLYVFQATKDGNYKGNQDFAHDVDVVISVNNGKAITEKSRFGGSGEITIF
ncbi:MAG: hypothetical protein JXR60_11530 [Bacteroidales bacterium]|nr:hypothetical protein [Bacteroidales bacterium]